MLTEKEFRKIAGYENLWTRAAALGRSKKSVTLREKSALDASRRFNLQLSAGHSMYGLTWIYNHRLLNMQHLFMDESGDLGFGVGSAYLIIAFIAPSSGKVLSKTMKNFNAHLIRNGWNQKVEIKASNVWHAPKNADLSAAYKYKNNPSEPIQYVLQAIADVDGYIEYVVVKLDTVSAGLRTAPEGILYNYFAWQLLKGPLCYFPTVKLFIDRRNVEYHDQLKFDGYLESKTGIERAEKGKPPINLHIYHYYWGSAKEFKAEQRAEVEFGIRGIEAADFVCWAIKQKFENANGIWYSVIEKRIKWKQHLYF